LTARAEELLRELFPICRSITGNGLRRTLELLRLRTPFALHEVPSGTICYDWTVPDEWNVRDAYVADSAGRRLIDFQANNLHLVNYSLPFEGQLTFDELAPHLHTLPGLPAAIPYRTTYYNRDWGFCLSDEQFQKLDRSASYRVVVDTTLTPGALTYGEALLPGRSGQGAADGFAQPAVGVGDDQTHPVKAPVAEAAQELGPEQLILGIANGDIQYLPVAV